MRSDSEQLAVILSRKEAVERKRRKNRRLLASACAFFVVLSATVAIYASTQTDRYGKDFEASSAPAVREDIYDAALDADVEGALSCVYPESAIVIENSGDECGDADIFVAFDSEISDNISESVSFSSECDNLASDVSFAVLYESIVRIGADGIYERVCADLLASVDNMSDKDESINAVGNALKCMMDIYGESRYYQTVIRIEGADGLESYKAVLPDGSRLKENADAWKQLDNGAFYYAFSQDDILMLAESGITCSYVGAGDIELPEDFAVYTEADIELFCEAYGDLYVNEN